MYPITCAVSRLFLSFSFSLVDSCLYMMSNKMNKMSGTSLPLVILAGLLSLLVLYRDSGNCESIYEEGQNHEIGVHGRGLGGQKVSE